MNNMSVNYGYIPLAFGIPDRSEGASSDFYNVYVNGVFVGNKISYSLKESGRKIIDDYLSSRNENGYDIQTRGNEIYIETPDPAQSRRISNNMNVYLNIR